MATNREHFEQTETNVEELAELGVRVDSVVLPDAVTGEFEGRLKKIKIVNGIITEIELEE